MKCIVKCHVRNEYFKRCFVLDRDGALTPIVSSVVYGYISSLLRENRDVDFSVVLSFVHDQSWPDLFDKFNCEIVNDKTIIKMNESVTSRLYDLLVWITNNYSKMPSDFQKFFSEKTCVSLRQDMFNSLHC